jgi:4-carboxymuconolactone decarboxylase
MFDGRQMNERPTGRKTMSDEKVWSEMKLPDIAERLENAKKIRAKMGIYGPGGQSSKEFYEISPVHTQGLMEWCFGMIWSQPELDPKMKEVAVLAAMVAQDFHNEIEWHVKSGLNLGLKREEIIALIIQCTPYCGYPKVNHALHAALRAFKSHDETKAKKGKNGKKKKKNGKNRGH